MTLPDPLPRDLHQRHRIYVTDPADILILKKNGWEPLIYPFGYSGAYSDYYLPTSPARGFLFSPDAGSKTLPKNVVPLFRLSYPPTYQRYYTTFADSRTLFLKHGWTDEGTLGFVDLDARPRVTTVTKHFSEIVGGRLLEYSMTTERVEDPNYNVLMMIGYAGGFFVNDAGHFQPMLFAPGGTLPGLDAGPPLLITKVDGEPTMRSLRIPGTASGFGVLDIRNAVGFVPREAITGSPFVVAATVVLEEWTSPPSIDLPVTYSGLKAHPYLLLRRDL